MQYTTVINVNNLKNKLMRKIVFMICMLHGITMFSQAHFPAVTDYGSLIGSGGNTALYIAIRNNDRKLVKEIDNFNKKYRQRTVYLIGSSAFITAKLNNELVKTKERYEYLVKRNKSMVFFSYSKKKNNTKTLKTIDQMLDNMEKELRSKISINVLYGEKLNLYQNAMESFSNIHRLMDVVEDRVEQSMLLDFITRRR